MSQSAADNDSWEVEGEWIDTPIEQYTTVQKHGAAVDNSGSQSSLVASAHRTTRAPWLASSLAEKSVVSAPLLLAGTRQTDRAWLPCSPAVKSSTVHCARFVNAITRCLMRINTKIVTTQPILLSWLWFYYLALYVHAFYYGNTVSWAWLTNQ